jgi:hypothetical protein
MLEASYKRNQSNQQDRSIDVLVKRYIIVELVIGMSTHE